MRTDLQTSLWVQFEEATPLPANTDWQERGSNFCLYFLRAAFGDDCKLDTLNANPEQHCVLTKKTQSLALRILAGIMAFTLWLPLTAIGWVMYQYSSTHDRHYLVAQIALKINPYPQMNAEDLVAHLKNDRINPTDLPGEYKLPMLREAISRLSSPAISPNEQDDIIYKLNAIYTNATIDELALYLPLITNHPHRGRIYPMHSASKRYLFGVADLIVKRIVAEKTNLWDTWNDLWTCWKSATGESSNDFNLFLDRALRNIGNDPDLLLKLYQVSTKSDCYLLNHLTDDQIVTLTQKLQKPNQANAEPLTPTDEVFFNLTRQIAIIGSYALNNEKRRFTLQEIIHRVALVPQTLGQKDSLDWMLKSNINGRTMTPYNYLMMHEVVQLFSTVPKLEDKDILVQLNAIFDKWNKYEADAVNVSLNQSHFTEELMQLTAQYADKWPLIFQSLTTTIENDHNSRRGLRVEYYTNKFVHALFKRKNQAEPVSDSARKKYFSEAEERYSGISYNFYLSKWHGEGRSLNLHHIAGKFMQAALQSSDTADKMQPALDAYLHGHAVNCRHICKKPFLCMNEVVANIKTVEMLKKAFDTVLMASIPLVGGKHNCLIRLLTNKYRMNHIDMIRRNLSTIQLSSMFEERRQYISNEVRTALGDNLLPQLKDIVLSYYLSVGETH